MSKKVTGVTGWSEKMGILAGGGKMSIENPFNPMWGWKVDPDNRQDRSDGPVIVRKMTEEEKIKYGMTVEGEDGMKITKVAVKGMVAEGMNTAEIAEYFLPYYPKMTKTLMMSKVSALLSDKVGRPRKKAELVDDERIQSAINSHEDHPEATSITKATEQAKKQVDDAAHDSAEKIKLRQAVDEMLEMVPDSVNCPAHYTAGKIEVIDFIQDKLTAEEFEGFCKGVIIQYIVRSRLKGGLEDLKKAEWYLDRIIKTMETA